MPTPSLADLFETLAAALEPHLRDAVLQAFAALQSAVDESHLRAALEGAGTDRAKLSAAVDVLLNDTVTDVAFQPMKDALRAAVATGGPVVSESIGSLLAAAPKPGAPLGAAVASVGGTIRVTFDAVNPRVITELRQSEAALFPQLATDARAGAVQLLADAAAEGKGPAEAARAVRPLLGLTEYQAKVVANFRRELTDGHAGALDRQLRDKRFDKTVTKAVAGDVTLTPEQVDRMTDAYARKLLAQSAETFARTESLNALKRAQKSAWDQAIASGAVAGDDLVKVWHATQDARTRPAHAAMHGIAVPYEQPWDVPGEGLEDYPGGAPGVYNCRCSSTVKPRWLHDGPIQEQSTA